SNRPDRPPVGAGLGAGAGRRPARGGAARGRAGGGGGGRAAGPGAGRRRAGLAAGGARRGAARPPARPAQRAETASRGADRRRARMFDQLPEMLDNMVRLITIGNSMAAAFQAAAANTSEPLREVVERAAHLSRSSQELDAALAQVARQYDFEELRLLAAVV